MGEDVISWGEAGNTWLRMGEVRLAESVLECWREDGEEDVRNQGEAVNSWLRMETEGGRNRGNLKEAKGTLGEVWRGWESWRGWERLVGAEEVWEPRWRMPAGVR
jgi:hypothetical protein